MERPRGDLLGGPGGRALGLSGGELLGVEVLGEFTETRISGKEAEAGK